VADANNPTPFEVPDFEAQVLALGTHDRDSIFRKIGSLTREQKLVFHFMLSGDSPATACRKAGFKSTNPVKTIAKKIPDLMKRVGLTDEILLKKLKSLLDAKETKFFQFQGGVTETREVEALGIQQSSLDMAFKLRGAYVRDAEQDRPGDLFNVQIINIGGE